MFDVFTRVVAVVIATISLGGSTPLQHARARQLDSPNQLGRAAETLFHDGRIDLLSSPYVVTTADNALTFVLATGDWRRLDESVNVLSDFLPGTGLLYTNNNNGFDLNGQGRIGGGGSGPIEITFADGVRAVGFQAQTNVLGLETFTFSAYNGSDLLATFTVSRSNGQREDGSAAFLGVRAIGDEMITRMVVSSVVFQAGQPHANDFSIGPVSYRSARGGAPDMRVN